MALLLVTEKLEIKSLSVLNELNFPCYIVALTERLVHCLYRTFDHCKDHV